MHTFRNDGFDLLLYPVNDAWQQSFGSRLINGQIRLTIQRTEAEYIRQQFSWTWGKQRTLAGAPSGLEG